METSLPQVDYCILCDDIRPEPGNKANILGFFGVLPRVEIRIREWGLRIPLITFLVSLHGARQPFTVKAVIFNPDGTTLIASNPIQGGPLSTDMNNAGVAFGFPMIQFIQQGQHRIQILVNDKTEGYSNTFVVKEGAGPSAEPSMQVGRNQPCPCGSGKKFKKCHGAPT